MLTPQSSSSDDTLKEMILARIPHRARLIKMIDRPMTVNRIGDEGQNMDSFTAGLVLDMDQSGWSSMTVAEATVLYWLKDLDATKKHQAELGDLIHQGWDRAYTEQVPFTVQDCVKIWRKHWDNVQQNKMTLSRWQWSHGIWRFWYQTPRNQEKEKEK